MSDTSTAVPPARATLSEYRLLGQTGIRVSPLACGTATFGQAWEEGWSCDQDTAFQIFHGFVAAGGNYFDTADMYHDGESERWLGAFMAKTGLRDRLVVSSKGAMNMFPGDPNGGGNGRKYIVKAVEASLKRLGTDYIDVYSLHHWDRITPVEEVLETFHLLSRQGKILTYGLSNFPAWYVSQLYTMAGMTHRPKVSSVQNQYSLTARQADYEHVPMCDALKISYVAWSPLANGLLSGKYVNIATGAFDRAGRLTQTWTTDSRSSNPTSKRNRTILRKLLDVAENVGRSPAQVSLNWLVNHTSVTSAIIGARNMGQMTENLAALDFSLNDHHILALNTVSQVADLCPYYYHRDDMQSMFHAGTQVVARSTT